MGLTVNWWAVVLAMLSTMVVGTIWYAKPVFGRFWMKLIGKSEKEMAKNGMVRPIVLTLVASFFSAAILAYAALLCKDFFRSSYLEASLLTAFWLWLGFVAARMLTHDAFEGRPWQLTVLNMTHELVTFTVMGLIIGLMPV
jgi:uncharacterized membrane protein